MFRKYVSIILLISLIALASSGLLMIILNSLEFQFRMHPVHKIFGILMCISGAFHAYFNFKPIKNYFKDKKLAFVGAVLTVLMVILYTVGLNKPMDPNAIQKLEKIAEELH